MNGFARTIISLPLALSTACGAGEVATPDVIAIRGRVVDATTEEPGRYASVTLPDMQTGVAADSNGTFAFQVSRPETNDLILVVRRIGYERQRLHIRLTPDSIQEVGTVRMRQAPLQVFSDTF
jgi:hypothetical protein